MTLHRYSACCCLSFVVHIASACSHYCDTKHTVVISSCSVDLLMSQICTVHCGVGSDDSYGLFTADTVDADAAASSTHAGGATTRAWHTRLI